MKKDKKRRKTVTEQVSEANEKMPDKDGNQAKLKFYDKENKQDLQKAYEEEFYHIAKVTSTIIPVEVRLLIATALKS